jgi:hypothetical protein
MVLDPIILDLFFHLVEQTKKEILVQFLRRALLRHHYILEVSSRSDLADVSQVVYQGDIVKLDTVFASRRENLCFISTPSRRVGFDGLADKPLSTSLATSQSAYRLNSSASLTLSNC